MAEAEAAQTVPVVEAVEVVEAVGMEAQVEVEVQAEGRGAWGGGGGGGARSARGQQVGAPEHGDEQQAELEHDGDPDHGRLGVGRGTPSTLGQPEASAGFQDAQAAPLWGLGYAGAA